MEHKRDNYLKIRDNFIFFIIFILGYWFSTLLLPFINISNTIFIVIFTGWVIETTSKIIQKGLWAKPFIIDRFYLFWVSIMVIGFALGNWVALKILVFDNIYYKLLFIGLIITIFWRITWFFRLDKKLLEG